MSRAFVAPADIQDFTSEAKNKLLSRCQGKSKQFSQAVKEICEAFDELQKKNSGDLLDDIDRGELGCDARSVDGIEENELEGDVKGQIRMACSDEEAFDEEIGDSGAKLERCSQRRVDSDNLDVKPSVGDCAGEDVSEKKGKLRDVAHSKKDIIVKSGLDSSPHREQAVSSDGHGALSNGHKLKMGAGSKRKSEGGVEVHKNSSSVVTSLKDERLPKSSEHLKNGMKNKNAPIGNKKELSSEDKRDSEVSGGKKAKGVSKAKNQKVPNDTRFSGVDCEEQSEDKLPGRTKKSQPGHSKLNMETEEISHPAKRSKHVDAGEDTPAGSLSKSKKGFSPPISERKSVAKSDLTRSNSRGKAESHLTSRSQNAAPTNVSSDEAALPLSKRRRGASEAMSNSPNQVYDIKMEKGPESRIMLYVQVM